MIVHVCWACLCLHHAWSVLLLVVGQTVHNLIRDISSIFELQRAAIVAVTKLNLLELFKLTS